MDTTINHVRNTNISNYCDKYRCSLYSLVDDDNNQDNDFDPSEMEDYSAVNNERRPSVFYCHQEDVHLTLIDGTLNEQGIGKCNIFNRVVTCPIEIECRTDEADACCEGNHDLTSS